LFAIFVVLITFKIYRSEVVDDDQFRAVLLDGVYSGLYILTEIEFEIIKQIICSEHFIEYIRLLKNYKSGGYFTFSSKDLEQYLNYQLTLIYGQSRISNGSRELF
jgi:adenine-specific DNA-methyltransferase